MEPARIVATYPYHDESGELLFEVVRYDPKDFRQRCPDKASSWSWSLNGVRRVLYRLPELASSDHDQPVFIVEGEKDADRLGELGLVATTNAGGAGKWKPDYNQSLRGRHVVIIPDNDEPGRKHAKAVAKVLDGVAASVLIVELPGLPNKGDVCDWLDLQGNDKIKLLQLVHGAARESKAPADEEDKPPEAVVIQLASVEAKPVVWLWDQRIPRGMVTLLDGDPGLGKSFITFDLAARISQGWPMPPDAGERIRDPGNVLLMNGEDDLARTIRPRLDSLGADLDRIIAVQQVGDRPPLLPDDLQTLEGVIADHKVELFVVDPIFGFFSGDTDGNKEVEARKVMHGLRWLAERTGAAVLVVRHLNKDKGNASDPLYRGGGSIGIIGSARSALLIAKDPDDDHRRVLAPLKCNLCGPPEALAYSIDEQGRLGWAGAVEVSAAELLAKSKVREDRQQSKTAVRTAGTKILLALDELDPERRGVSKRKLREVARVSGRDMECGVLDLARHGVILQIPIEISTGTGHQAKRTVEGIVRRKPGTDGTDGTE